jgi:hypothetical protein
MKLKVWGAQFNEKTFAKIIDGRLTRFEPKILVK